ncbi:MAG: hypothetical protein MSH41_06390 [Bacteroidales bacterium]|nr:hypothetical protein [Bacteroidales bacterium]
MPPIDDVLTIGDFYVEPGRIVCEGDFRIYDLLGRDVTRLNGSLCGWCLRCKNRRCCTKSGGKIMV